MERKCKNIDTMLVRDTQSNPWNAINVPVCFNSTYEFCSVGEAELTFNGVLDNFCYSRLGNPTVVAFEEKINEIESGYKTFAFSTGMAAITAVILSLCKPGDFISCIEEVYGGTHELLKTVVENLNISVFTFCSDFSGLRTTKTALKKTKLIFIETPTNPSLHLVDLRRAMVEAYMYEDVYVCVDNTFATPYFQQPIYQYGVDLVIHSATKYIGGHGDLLGGTITVSERNKHLADRIHAVRTSTGATMDPMTAFLCLRGLKSLGVRMQRHTINALAISSLFDEYDIPHTYPNFSGMLSVEFDSRETAQTFIQNLRCAKLAVSLGETQTLVSVPSLTTHASYNDEELYNLGLGPGVVRVSVGLEDPVELKSDFERALGAL
jgi:cystathionine beta-lyase/cystathionine gamma-synthase